MITRFGNSELAQNFGILFGISVTTLLLILIGGVSQIIKHRKNPYQRAGAKSTTIHALLGLSLAASIIILLNLAERAFAAPTKNPAPINVLIPFKP